MLPRRTGPTKVRVALVSGPHLPDPRSRTRKDGGDSRGRLEGDGVQAKGPHKRDVRSSVGPSLSVPAEEK